MHVCIAVVGRGPEEEEGEEKEGVVGKPASWALPKLGVGTRATSLTTEEGSKK